MNGGKKTIPGIWFVYTGALGDVKTVRRNEEILSGGIRSYNIDYAKLAGEIGVVKKMEIYPIENINGSFACQNMRVYTIPEEYCKPAEATRVNEDGSVNSTGEKIKTIFLLEITTDLFCWNRTQKATYFRHRLLIFCPNLLSSAAQT